MDQLFIDELDFRLPVAEYRRCAASWSAEETLRLALEAVGLELIDYGSCVYRPFGRFMDVQARSKAWRARAERSA